MGDKLNYIVEDNIIAEVLGRNNFSTKESAILELIKNAYDAGSNKLNLIFKKSENTGRLMLEIIDDGSGMNENDIRQAWMHVGKSTRDYKDSDTGRIFAGSKGIGRFALARLGESVDMFTKKKNDVGYHWQTNWNSSEIDIDYNIASQGTKIQINELRDKWSSKSIKPLKNYISKTYRDSKMKISIIFLVENGESLEEETELIWTNPKIGENYLESITINYDSKNKKLYGQVLLDEFNDSVWKMTNKNIKEYHFEQNMVDELKKEISKLIIEEEDVDKKDITDEMIAELLKEVGSFKGELYFSLNNVTQVDKEKYEYKHDTLSNRFKGGVILYRNAFSIDSFEGRTDWLELGKRSSSSPAAASHPTGSWRVRRNQLSGYIIIDKEENACIEDISNRQGIVQNIHFKILKKIVVSALEEFEAYRQSIIRDIKKIKDKEDSTSVIKEVDIENKIDSFIDHSRSIEELTIQDLVEVRNRLLEYKNKFDDIMYEKLEVEENYRYEAQLLNVLATVQLKISSLSHELHNNRNTIAVNPQKIEDILRRKYNWEELKSEVPSSRNIPSLLKNLKKDLEKVLDLSDTIIDENKKERFEPREYSLEVLVEEIVEKWKTQYNWVHFKTNFTGEDIIIISYDYLMIILDNLILNSVQVNECRKELEISVDFDYNKGKLLLEYSDNGEGLDKKYKNNPSKILNVHEGTREDGHGLGMWMVNNTVYKLNGNISIDGETKGFNLKAEMNI
ncbi:sensor histidine kinase [Streptococcus salivarius]|jgi:putative histidine kinase (fragment)|uniref:sensor histidine kinase n=1 Tax=Streptococcus salivarius TaxID=1304 RepID=UPI000FED78C8|nr:ATP-binding protein [Streptococcus salivarius]MDB8588359.1 ATP-binding protein [Streptococcus salivarius]MDB8593208.1 ATP-binding protein [Streptococcus salivarius]MDB8595222.1 ATP-binding protein [Streptococcus salivarius]MDB8600791.1 ATP-binding protein [Streptococcus salivarius]MTR23009.1 ATP-binding protein [Streptococcus salivarius]